MGLGTGFDHILDRREAEFFSFGYTQPGARHLEIKYAKHGGARNAREGNILSADIVRHRPAAAIGPQGQRDLGFFSGHDMVGIRAVAGGIDVVIRCPQIPVHRNGFLNPQFETRGFGNPAAGGYPDADQHHLSGKR